MSKSKVDDPWTAFPLDEPKPKRAIHALPQLPQPPQIPGPDIAPIAECSLEDAWNTLLRARRDYVAALHHRAIVSAQLSIAYRENCQGSQRPTIAATQEHCLTQPAYIAAVDLVHGADVAYYRALAGLELARVRAGLLTADASFKLPVEW